MTYAVRVATALGLVLSTGVALVALLVPGITEALQIALIAFGNAVIALGVILVGERYTTPVAAPKIPSGTDVEVITPDGAPNTSIRV